MKVLLDTNVLIAAFIAHGVCSELLEHCVRQHSLVTSEFILNEFQEKLIGKFNYSQAEAEEAAELLLSRMEVVTPADLDAAVCRDADDDNILAAAVTGNCDCIITGDKDLLVLKRYGSFDIFSPSDFLRHETTKADKP